MPTKECALKRLDEISDYAKGWNGYEAEPFDPKLIDKCKNIVDYLSVPPMVFPTANDSIQFEYKNGETYLEVEIFSNRYHIFCRVNGISVNTDLDEAIEAVGLWNILTAIAEKQTKGGKMLHNLNRKPQYLVYQVGSCEQGSEGASSRYFACIAEGDTKSEVIQNWVENVELLYGIKPHPQYNKKSDTYTDYYPIYMNRLIGGYENAQAEPITIIDRYRDHKTGEIVEDAYEAKY